MYSWRLLLSFYATNSDIMLALFKWTVQIFFLFSNSWLCTIDDRDATGTGSGTPLAVQYVTAVQSKQKVYRE